MGPLFRAPVVVLDTETTGFPGSEWAEVVEIGAVLLDRDAKEIASFETLLRPEVLDERAARALEVNHLTVEQLQGAPDRTEALLAWDAWVARHEVRWLTAYNVAFDRPMLERTSWVTTARWADCIMERASRNLGARGRLRLASAAAQLGVPLAEPAHRALSDARTAAGVLRAVVLSERSRVKT